MTSAHSLSFSLKSMIKLKKLNFVQFQTVGLGSPEGELGRCYGTSATTTSYRCVATARSYGTVDVLPSQGRETIGTLRERFIQRLMLSGKKSVATKVFDESLELLMNHIKEHNSKSDRSVATQRTQRTQDNLYSLANLTKDEIFIISLRKAQP
jgi:phosphoribosyl-ATP pyrophosphohydrolase